jgi:hypothetical protein
MTNPRDIASELTPESVAVPFPPAQRRIVLALYQPFTQGQIKKEWLRWAGDSEFPFSGDDYGIGIITAGLSMPHAWCLCVLRIFARGGDVFEFCPVKKNFRRLTEEDFRLYYCQ